MGRIVKLSSDTLAVSASVSCMDIGHFDDSIDAVNRGTACAFLSRGDGTRG